ncbi:uncharacterized protein LOC141612506 [Silene latifolia]|uniref:uncharacterized protein LOC141612506 n=1 Tax=Silene latifolia TaxID=37657 RepID=UPI003D781B1B
MQSSGLSVYLPNFNPTPLLPLITARRTINSPKSAAVSVSVSVSVFKNKIKCSNSDDSTARSLFRTCKNCKTQFDSALNHPLACRFHPAHFGGETKRKFESVHTGGTMNTPNSGQVLEYWHCCGSEDAFDPGCTSSPHLSYDD